MYLEYTSYIFIYLMMSLVSSPGSAITDAEALKDGEWSRPYKAMQHRWANHIWPTAKVTLGMNELS